MAVVSIGVNLNGFGGDVQKMEDAIINLQKNLAYLLEHMDSANIKSIDAHKTAIRIGGRAAASGSFVTADGKRVTVAGGIIEKIEEV